MSTDPAPEEDGDSLVLRVTLPTMTPRPAPADARRLRVHTTSGAAYDLDPATMTATRLRAGDEVPLRRDGEALDMWQWPHLQVGHPLQLVLSVREDIGAPTLRMSTPVTRIEPR